MAKKTKTEELTKRQVMSALIEMQDKKKKAEDLLQQAYRRDERVYEQIKQLHDRYITLVNREKEDYNDSVPTVVFKRHSFTVGKGDKGWNRGEEVVKVTEVKHVR